MLPPHFRRKCCAPTVPSSHRTDLVAHVFTFSSCLGLPGYGVPLQADIPVTGMMTKLQNAYPERRDELMNLLGIDPNWRMHRVSDGQRRYDERNHSVDVSLDQAWVVVKSTSTYSTQSEVG